MEEKEIVAKEEISISTPGEVKQKDSRRANRTIFRVFEFLFIISIAAAILYVGQVVLTSLNETVHIETKNNPVECQLDSCISFDAIYNDGESVWQIREGWQIKFISAGKRFDQDNIGVSIRCPITSQSNELLAKISFILSQQGIGDCVVERK